MTLLALVTAAFCASSGAVRTPVPFPSPRSAPAPPVSSPVGSAPSVDVSGLTRTALELRGTPYVFGGTDPSGFDCSGFVQYVFQRHRVLLPRQVPELYRVGVPVDRSDVEPGDLLFFSTIAPGASHVALALDQEAFVHAPSQRGVVRVEHLTSRYWSERFIGARRVLGGPPAVR